MLARCVSGALLISHGIRSDAEIMLVLRGDGGPRLVRISGSEVKRLNPDERSTVALLSRALEAQDVGKHETTVTPGIYTSKAELEEVLSRAAAEGPVTHLTEEGTAELEEWRPDGATVTVVLSDHRDPTPEERGIIDRFATEHVSLGPVSLQADQCTVLVHNRLDRLRRS